MNADHDQATGAGRNPDEERPPLGSDEAIGHVLRGSDLTENTRTDRGFSALNDAEWEALAAWIEFFLEPWKAYKVLQDRGLNEAEIDDCFDAISEGLANRMGEQREAWEGQ